jgi:hypothetical protein
MSLYTCICVYSCVLTSGLLFSCLLFNFSLPLFLLSPPLSLILWDTQTPGQPLLVNADDLKMELQSLKGLPWSERYFPIISKLAGHKEGKYAPLVDQHSTHYGAQGESLVSPREEM